MWRDGLIHKLHELKIPPRFIKYIRNFLSGRKTWVEVNGVRSKPFFLTEGLPQGSCIAPLLFLIYINDIGVDLHPDTTASLFADDTATWLRDGTIRGSSRTLAQEEVQKIVDWAKQWKMKINADKTRTMVTSSAEADLTWDPNLKINNSMIKNVKDYKFLGVTINNNLRFTKHINAIISKCRKRIKIIKCLATKSWGCSPETQRRLYIQYIRSVIEYASSSWHGWICKTHIRRLQSLQNEAMRAISGLPKTCPQDFLHLETNLDPIAVRLAKNDQILWDKYERLPTNDSRKELTTKQIPSRLTSRIGFRFRTAESFPFKDLTRETTSPRIEPWISLPNLSFQQVQLDKKKEEYEKEELRGMSLDKIISLEKEVNIYTDGSTSGNQTHGGAGVFIEDKQGTILHEESRPAGKFCSSYTGECVAFLMATEWIAAQPRPLDCLICTDSKSLYESLKNNDWTDTDPWLKQIKVAVTQTQSQITLLWIPSHCDITGNDKADKLADSGTRMSQSNIPVTHEIIKAKIRRAPWQISHPEAKETFRNRRKPQLDIESRWPRNVRVLYSQLRTGHCKELRDYRWVIEADDDNTCQQCNLQEPETINHVFLRCPILHQARHLHADGKTTMDMLVLDPDKSRQILAARFEGLMLPHSMEPEEQTATLPDTPTTRQRPANQMTDPSRQAPAAPITPSNATSSHMH